MATHLPDPQWSDAAALCPACGYSLAGLAPPTACPECGLVHTGRQFIVHGVPSVRSAMPPWRLAAIIILCTGSFCFFQSIGFFIAANLGWIAVVISVALFVALVALIVTGRRGRGGGKCRLIFVNGGVYLTPLSIDPAKDGSADQSLIRFSGTERASFKPIGPVWGQLLINRQDGTTALRAGVRCPQQQADELLSTVDELIRCQPANSTNAPPTA